VTTALYFYVVLVLFKELMLMTSLLHIFGITITVALLVVLVRTSRMLLLQHQQQQHQQQQAAAVYK
jgi:hypothetical protein